MPHKRTDIDQDDIALSVLSGCQYKVLQGLVNRADARGVCFPSAETLARATGFNLRHVYRALQFINDCDVIRYIRRDEFDHVTRRKLPNAYAINPAYICLAVEFVAEARAFWDTLINQCGNRCLGLWSHINHQPTSVDQLPYPTPVDQRQLTSTNNQHSPKMNGRGADYANGAGANQKRKNGGRHDDSETNNQRGAHAPKSSVPPERPQYANPESINSNLPDAAHEGLAAQIREFGISMPLARGFVAEYGYSRTKLAFDQVRKMGENARQPAAVFRSIVQVRLAEDVALAHEQIFKNRKQS